MVQCKGTTRKGTPCKNGVMAGSEFCFFHSFDPDTGRRVESPPIDREKEIKIVEQTLRAARRQPPSLEKARTIISLVQLLEQLRKPEEKEKPWKPPAL